MKKHISTLLVLAIGASLCGCGGTVIEPATKPVKETQTVNDILAAGMEEADAANESSAESTPALSAAESASNVSSGESTGSGRQSGTDEGAPAPEGNPDPEAISATEGIDVDLTALSSTMVYSEVYDMLARPELYTGKTVKMRGQFTYYHDVPKDYYYYACIIQDATACCSQGIEFEPAGDYTYPDDFPEVGTDVTVVGVFDSYMEGQYRYCTLRNAVFTS